MAQPNVEVIIMKNRTFTKISTQILYAKFEFCIVSEMIFQYMYFLFLCLPWQPAKLCTWHKFHVLYKGLQETHFYKSSVKISAVT